MVKKRDVVVSSKTKKKLENLIDLQQFQVDRERASLATRDATDEAVRRMLSWLPTIDEIEASATSVAQLLRIKGQDGRTFFGVASNTHQQASSFFGTESVDGTTRSIGAFEWFIVGRLVPGKGPAVIRQSDLEGIAAARTAGVVPSFVSTMAPMVQQGPLN